jgi:hypothetical protein
MTRARPDRAPGSCNPGAMFAALWYRRLAMGTVIAIERPDIIRSNTWEAFNEHYEFSP